MDFIWPNMLLALLLIPVVIGLYVWMQQRRKRLVDRYGNMMRLSDAVTRRRTARRHIPPAFFLLALTLLLIALARPQATVGLPRIEGTVLLTFDISGSMAAEDFEPTRIEAAKAAAEAFVERQPPTVRLGVVAFSDSGLAIQQPTYDQSEVLKAIRRLTTSRGTSLGNGILATLNVLVLEEQETNYYSSITPNPEATPTPVPEGTYVSTVIILLTDGENTEDPGPDDGVQAAINRGVRIYTVGIGSPTGTVLNIEGFNVFTQLNEGLLMQISEATGGAYYNAQDADDLLEIYENIDRQFVVRPEPMETTPLFAGASLLLLLIGGTLSFLWFGRVP